MLLLVYWSWTFQISSAPNQVLPGADPVLLLRVRPDRQGHHRQGGDDDAAAEVPQAPGPGGGGRGRGQGGGRRHLIRWSHYTAKILVVFLRISSTSPWRRWTWTKTGEYVLMITRKQSRMNPCCWRLLDPVFQKQQHWTFSCVRFWRDLMEYRHLRITILASRDVLIWL